MVATPSSVKSFMLKFLELAHKLNGQKSLADERSLTKPKRNIKSSLAKLLGISKTPPSSCVMTEEELADCRSQAAIAEEIFGILRDSVEIMDEVDVILHPLKSELNWPLGAKEPLDFTRSRSGTGLRWSIPSHLLDAVFCCCGMPILADIADSKHASECTAIATQ